MTMNKDFLRTWVGDIVIAVVMSAIEIGFLSLFLWLLNLLPHGIAWLSGIGFFQWVVIVTTFKIITYRYNQGGGGNTPTESSDINNGPIDVPMYNSITYDEPENNTRPVRNVYNQTETDELNRNSEYSVRE